MQLIKGWINSNTFIAASELPRAKYILTEDIGIIHGIDNCKCGKLGKYFSVLGRVPDSELRGCSDVN